MGRSRLLFIALVFALALTLINGFPTVNRQVTEAEESPDASPEASPEEEEVCVDAKHLASYPSHALVHSTAIRAPVLCPPASLQLPCATGDHKLRINGQAMSYKEYCTTMVSCESKRIPVNSVLSHLWEESSHDNGNIKLTMFDARHPEYFQLLIHRMTSIRRSIAGSFV